MRRMLLVAASAAALSLLGGAGAGAAPLSGSGMRAAADQVGQLDQVRRVCREVCREGFCRQRCWNDDNYGYRERRVYRDWDDDDVVVRRGYRRGPGVGIYGPGVGVEVGPGW
jgi:hypothetical protein